MFPAGDTRSNRGGGVVGLLEGNWRVETILGAQSWININHTRAAGLFLSPARACAPVCRASTEGASRIRFPRSCSGFCAAFRHLELLRPQEVWSLCSILAVQKKNRMVNRAVYFCLYIQHVWSRCTFHRRLPLPSSKWVRMTSHYLLQEASARKVAYTDPDVRVHRYVVLSSRTSELRTTPPSRNWPAHLRPAARWPIETFWGGAGGGGRRFISRSTSGRGSALWVPFISAEGRRELWGVRLTGRREGKEEGKEKSGSASQNACQ